MTSWWVFYIDPTKEDSHWRTAGMISAPDLTADEAIQKTLGRYFQQPFWAFALNKGDFGSYYQLHYPDGREVLREKHIGPAGYVAVERTTI